MTSRKTSSRKANSSRKTNSRKSLWHTTESFKIVEPNFYQAVILLADYKEIFVSTGVGAGKTSLAPIWLSLKQLQFGGGNVIWIEPITRMLSTVAIPTYESFVKDTIFEGKWKSKKENVYKNKFGFVYFLTAENAEHIQGIPDVVAVVMDEAGQCSRKAYYYAKARLKRTNGYLLGLSNPYVNKDPWMYKEVYQDYLNGDPDILFLTYSSLENPAFNKEVYEKDKKKLSPEELDFLYHGKFVKPQGLVFDYPNDLIVDIDISTNELLKKFEEEHPGRNFIGMDFGFGDPTVMIVGRWSEGKLYLIDEYYRTGLAPSEHADAVARFVKRYNVGIIFYDPSGIKDRLEIDKILKEKGIRVTWKTANNDIQKGLRAVDTFFKERKMFISASMRHMLDEDNSYVYNSKGLPEDRNNHCEDARRYLVMGIIRLTDKRRFYRRPTKKEADNWLAEHFHGLFKKKKKDWISYL